MKLLPKIPLDSSPLRRGTERRCDYFEKSDPKKREKGRKRESPMHLVDGTGRA
jgi:hypothetical protein